jgi:hypothetical protein
MIVLQNRDVAVAMCDDGYIGRRAQEATLGCHAGAAYQAVAYLAANVINDHRRVPPAAAPPPQQPRDEAGQLIDARDADDSMRHALLVGHQAAVVVGDRAQPPVLLNALPTSHRK